MRPRFQRGVSCFRRPLSGVVLGLVMCVAVLARAWAETTVPIDLQVELFRKVVRFERGFAARAGNEVKVLVVGRPGHAESERAVVQLGKVFAGVKEIGGKPLKVSVHKFVNAPTLKDVIVVGGAHLVYLTPGFQAELPAIASALAGIPVITATTDGDQVAYGAVLGFELVSARPKIVLHLAQARKQGLDFNSDLFRLARVIK